MGSEMRIVERGARLRWRLSSILLLISFVCAATASAQYPAQYPSQSQVSKDGTAVLLEDYVNLPLSNPTQGNIPRAQIDYKAQLGRATSLRSEASITPSVLRRRSK